MPELEVQPQTNLKKVHSGERKVNPAYKMESTPRGICLIISNKEFENRDMPSRHGTELDAKNLEDTFKWLQFEVRILNDLTAHEIYKQTKSCSQMNHKHYDGFVCCFLSHGSLGRNHRTAIYGTDGRLIAVEDLRRLFVGDTCGSLHGKPKLFLIQACRGERTDKGRYLDVEADGPTDYPNNPIQSYKMVASDSDFACLYASMPGIVLEFAAYLSLTWRIQPILCSFGEYRG